MDRPPLTHVAIRFQSKVWSLPRPYRHHHIIRIIMYLDNMHGGELTTVDAHGDDQGFLDGAGQYLTRKEAEARATLTGQIKNGKMIGSVLTSEDLW